MRAIVLLILALTLASGCTSYQVTAHDTNTQPLSWDKDFTFTPQTLAHLRATGIGPDLIPDTAPFVIPFDIKLQPENIEGQTPALSGTLGWVTLGMLYPIHTRSKITTVVEITDGLTAHASGTTVHTHESRESLLFWPLFWPGQKVFGGTLANNPDTYAPTFITASEYGERTQQALLMALRSLSQALAQDKAAIVAASQRNSRQDPLKVINSQPSELARAIITYHYVANHPKRNELEWHAGNARAITHYAHYIPREYGIYFIGPTPGLSPWDIQQRLAQGENADLLLQQAIAQRTPLRPNHLNGERRTIAENQLDQLKRQQLVQQWTTNASEATQIWRAGYYLDEPKITRYSKKEVQQLRALGLEDDFIAALGLPNGFIELLPRQAVATSVIMPRPNTVVTAPASQAGASALLNHNRGPFISPYLANGLLSPWVQMALTPVAPGATNTLKQSTGRALGSELGSRLGSQLGGGMFGSFAGRTLGGNVGAKAVAGNATTALSVEQMRPHANLSFSSLPAMAQHLKQHHSDKANFFQAVDATEKLYPGFKAMVYNTP